MEQGEIITQVGKEFSEIPAPLQKEPLPDTEREPLSKRGITKKSHEQTKKARKMAKKSRRINRRK